jgi:hypothetical protein
MRDVGARLALSGISKAAGYGLSTPGRAGIREEPWKRSNCPAQGMSATCPSGGRPSSRCLATPGPLRLFGDGRAKSDDGSRERSVGAAFVPRIAMAKQHTRKKRYGAKASTKVERAMRERKRGTLRSGRSGKKVTSRKQAIAIGLSQARRAGAKVPARRSSARRTSRRRRT